MSTWKCPKCGATNPSPIHYRPEITCGACSESFSTEFINKSAKPTPISKSTKFESKEKILNQKKIACVCLFMFGIFGIPIGYSIDSLILLIGSLILFFIGLLWIMLLSQEEEVEDINKIQIKTVEEKNHSVSLESFSTEFNNKSAQLEQIAKNMAYESEAKIFHQKKAACKYLMLFFFTGFVSKTYSNFGLILFLTGGIWNIVLNYKEEAKGLDYYGKAKDFKINLIKKVEEKTHSVISDNNSKEIEESVFGQNRQKFLLYSSTVMFVSFFLPWFSFNGLNINGAGILELREYNKACYLIILIPVFSFLAMVECLNPNLIPFKKSKMFPLYAGLSPYLVLFLSYLIYSNEVNNVIGLTSKLRDLSSGFGNNRLASKGFFELFSTVSLGFYLTVISSGLLIFYSPKK